MADVLNDDIQFMVIVVVALISAFIIGLLFTTWRSGFWLERLPFIVCLLLINLLLVVISAVGLWLSLVGPSMAGPPVAVWLTIVGMVPLGLFGMVSAARSRDVTGKIGYGFLALVPLVNLWLLFWPPKQLSVTADRWARRQITGAPGLRLTAILLVLNIASTVWLEKRTERWVAASFMTALNQVADAHLQELSGHLRNFASSVQVPIQLNEDFDLTEINAVESALLIRVDTSAWYQHDKADRVHYLPVFCRFEEVTGFLARGAEVTVSIHGPDGARAIQFTYRGSVCDS